MEESKPVTISDAIQYAGGVDEGVCGHNPLLHLPVGKPQIWIRLRPTPRYEDNVFQIESDGKSLRLLVEPDHRMLKKHNKSKGPDGKSKGIIFSSDGILQSSSQEDTYMTIVNDVVEKAMNGINGIIISLGPEVSGKSFTMFGYFSKFEYRGIIPRALERIFHLVESKSHEMNYIIRIGIIELRKDKIRDLLTLGPYELQHVGENGPFGMLLQQIGCADHGFGLLIRALAGQKNIPRESYARYHTVVYIDIHGVSCLGTEPRVSKSRITFAKIASIPRRSQTTTARRTEVAPFDGFMEVDGCIYARPTNPARVKFDPPRTTRTCCPVKSGPLAEAIGVRQDLSFLEQMFIRANELRKLHKYYAQLKTLKMTMLMKRPKSAPSQYFRQSKLAHCLQDIVSGCSEIRIILHIRPEKQYLNTTLEAIRFAERAKCIPYDKILQPKQDEPTIDMLKYEISLLRDELQLQEKLYKMPPELFDMQPVQLPPHQLHQAQQQAQEYLEGRLDQIEIISKAQLGAILECFRKLYQAEAELSKRVASEKGAQEPEEIVNASNSKTNVSKQAKKKSRRASKEKKKRDSNAITTSGSQGVLEIFTHQDPPTPSTGETTSAPPDLLLPDETIEGGEENEIPGESLPDQRKDSNGLEIPTQGPTDENKLNSNRSSLTLKVQPSLTEARKSLVDTLAKELSDIQTNLNATVDQKETPSKTEAWQAFLKTSKGFTMFQSVSQTDHILRNLTHEHNEVLKKVSNLLSKLNQIQENLDIVQQERHLKGEEYDQAFNVVISPQEKEIIRDIKVLQYNRDELLERLKTLRSQLFEQKQIVDKGKNDCDSAFQMFSLENYAVSFTKDEADLLTNIEPNAPEGDTIRQNEEEAAKHFNALKRLARQQAKEFLRYYPKRPAWNPY